ncbi:hypothetical protein DPMN_033745 [Dreissena polymorpha]|uniref:Uncharacterized protein n=1 Tax=Dreissena polymorpha TaxID=45954 RepID=A0A9D4RL97_DREPO|nr:hypothetical protein DPMN_033745 [Dreissena polymorpha]
MIGKKCGFKSVNKKNAPSPCDHVFQLTRTMFELVQDIIRIHLATKFHDDRKIYVLSIETCPAPWQPSTKIIFKLIFHENRTINVASRVLTRENAPPPGGHFFQATVSIFELVQDIVDTNLMRLKINVASKVLTRQILTPHNARRTKSDHKSSP